MHSIQKLQNLKMAVRDVIQDASSHGRANYPTSDSSFDSHEQAHYAFAITASSSPILLLPWAPRLLVVLCSLHQTCEINLAKARHANPDPWNFYATL